MSATQSQLLGAGIKSIQRGQAQVISGGVVTVTISSVNMSKSALSHNGFAGFGTTTDNASRIVFTSATSLSIYTGNLTSGTTTDWQVIEYY